MAQSPGNSERRAAEFDTGTAYDGLPTKHDPLLTEVGRGTPMGELMRRYWHPVATSASITSELPRRVRILGENLVLFRDHAGRAGLLAEKCRHRGTSLFFGRIEPDGLRCCYHGWKFDVQGHCIDQACEIDGGNRRNLARQPWYPVEERYGLIFAYMGPPERKPALPRWSVLEPLEEGEFYEISLNPGYGDGEILPFNWLQSYENTQDPLHAAWLHLEHNDRSHFGEERIIRNGPDTHDIIKDVTWGDTPLGVRYTRTSPVPGSDRRAAFTVEAILPHVFSVPNYIDQSRPGRQDQIGWHVPVDDTHFMLIQVARVREHGDLINRVALHNGKRWSECTPEELQQCPGDFEAQATQGAIAVHAAERLAASDRGVTMLRRRLRMLLKDLEAGNDLINVCFDPDAPPIQVNAKLEIID